MCASIQQRALQHSTSLLDLERRTQRNSLLTVEVMVNNILKTYPRVKFYLTKIRFTEEVTQQYRSIHQQYL